MTLESHNIRDILKAPGYCPKKILAHLESDLKKRDMTIGILFGLYQVIHTKERT